MKKLAILQSNYIPWKGYFDLISSVDELIIYDIVQYTKNDWRNRNQIICNGKKHWLTIPVRHQSLNQTINSTLVADQNWWAKHWKSLSQSYAKSKGFRLYQQLISDQYQQCSGLEKLSDINLLFIKSICKILGITTTIRSAEDFSLPDDRQERIVSLCHQTDASIYVSGPAAKAYIDTELFKENSIHIEWFNYEGYRPYQQSGHEFYHDVSILDLLFCTGSNAADFYKKESSGEIINGNNAR